MRRFKCFVGHRGLLTRDKIYEINKNDEIIYDNGKQSKYLLDKGTIDFKPVLGFYLQELIEEEGENKMEDLRELLRNGYVVEHIDGKLSRVEMNEDEKLIISGEQRYYPIKRNLDKNLEYDNGVGYWAVLGIKTIYGYCKYNIDAYKLSTSGREVIWKRKEKSSTQLEIESIESEQRKLADRLSKLKKEM